MKLMTYMVTCRLIASDEIITKGVMAASPDAAMKSAVKAFKEGEHIDTVAEMAVPCDRI